MITSKKPPIDAKTEAVFQCVRRASLLGEGSNSFLSFRPAKFTP